MSYGKSILVLSVQELAKEGIQDVPSIYVCPVIELLAVPADASLQFPVIDLDKLLDGNSMDSELQKLHSACQEFGVSFRLFHFYLPSLKSVGRLVAMSLNTCIYFP